jgi:Dolichyl-phosphate-mannose-protein mannosyltransferase
MDRGTVAPTPVSRSGRLNESQAGAAESHSGAAANAERIGAWLFVLALAIFSAWCLAPSISRAWFYRSDEYPVIGEIIRFAHFDFRQQYFDQPETPLMLACAAVWRLVYAAVWAGGLAHHGIDDFTFHHLPLLIGLARAASFGAGLIGIALVFVLASRLTNIAGGAVAAMVTAMCPIYGWSQSSIRPEPGVVCLFVLSILCLNRGLDGQAAGARREGRWIVAAGLLAGLAAAMRFHSITATLPLLALVLISNDAPTPHYPARLNLYWRRTLKAIFVAALVAMAGIRSGVLERTSAGRAILSWWPKAFGVFFVLFGLGAALIALVWMFERWHATAWLAGRVLHPRMFLLASSTILGFFAGTPTILWQPRYFIGSIQMYTTQYIDGDHVGWPLMGKMLRLAKYYLTGVASDPLTLGLLAAGAVLIAVRRDRKLLPYLITALLFFVSRPPDTLAFWTQMIPWLPLFAIIAGYAPALGFDQLAKMRHAAILRPAALAALLIAMGLTMKPGPLVTAAETAGDELRMDHIAQATEWMHGHAESGDMLAISYYCFNSDTFFGWLDYIGVPVPPSAGRRASLIWWGEHSALKGQRGYACLTPRDVDYIKRKLDLRSPGEGSDPFRDPGFTPAARFGGGANEVDVFRFDFVPR